MQKCAQSWCVGKNFDHFFVSRFLFSLSRSLFLSLSLALSFSLSLSLSLLLSLFPSLFFMCTLKRGDSIWHYIKGWSEAFQRHFRTYCLLLPFTLLPPTNSNIIPHRTHHESWNYKFNSIQFKSLFQFTQSNTIFVFQVIYVINILQKINFCFHQIIHDSIFINMHVPWN